jgi:hypothetical protein
VYSIAPAALSRSTTPATVDAFWPMADVHADHALALLVDDRVDRDRRLAGAAVADDQLALAAADRDHRVDGLDARLQRLLHRLADDDAGRLALHLARRGRLDRAAAVERHAERVHHAADERRADRHLQHARRAADLVALLQDEVVAEHHRADVVLLEVQRQPRDRLPGLGGGELEHLAGHGVLQPVHARDAVAHLEHGAHVLDVERVEVRRFDLAQQDVLDLARTEGGFGSHGSRSGGGRRGGCAYGSPRPGARRWYGRQQAGGAGQKTRAPERL